MKKTPSSGKSLISNYSVLGVVANLSLSGSGRKVWWGGRLFEAGRLLTFSAFRMGGYSRWALIRGWALIRINTVYKGLKGEYIACLQTCRRTTTEKIRAVRTQAKTT